MQKTKEPETLQDALDSVDEIIQKKGERPFLFFFDFDGTLAPIGPEPDKVALQQTTSQQLKKLAEQYSVAIVSGRDRDDIASRIAIEELYYAGSHGFDISGPGGTKHLHPKADDLMPKISEAADNFREHLSGMEGVWVEHKKFAVAIHFRQADADTSDRVKEIVSEKMKDEKSLMWDKGKSIIEIKPDVDWHKGKAVLWIMEHLGLNEDNCFPIYLGDDTTDEDAFKALRETGIGVLVDSNDQPTYAHYILHNQQEVSEFIKKIVSNV